MFKTNKIQKRISQMGLNVSEINVLIYVFDIYIYDYNIFVLIIMLTVNKVGKPKIVRIPALQDCYKFTFYTKLIPTWNRIENYLIQGYNPYRVIIYYII